MVRIGGSPSISRQGGGHASNRCICIARPISMGAKSRVLGRQTPSLDGGACFAHPLCMPVRSRLQDVMYASPIAHAQNGMPGPPSHPTVAQCHTASLLSLSPTPIHLVAPLRHGEHAASRPNTILVIPVASEVEPWFSSAPAMRVTAAQNAPLL